MKWIVLLIFLSLLTGCFGRDWPEQHRHYVVKPISTVVCGISVVDVQVLIIRENKDKFITVGKDFIYKLYYKKDCKYFSTGGFVGFTYYTEKNEGFEESLWNGENL